MTQDKRIQFFVDLTGKDRQRAIDYNRGLNTDGDWYRWILEEEEEKLKLFGFSDIKIDFSGFGSQGDGASFTATLNLLEFCKATKTLKRFDSLRKFFNESSLPVEIKRLHEHHYVHERSTDICFNTEYIHDEEWTPKREKQLQELETFLSRWMVNENKAIYKWLEADYLDLESDDSIAELMEINNYEVLVSTGQIV